MSRSDLDQQFLAQAVPDAHFTPTEASLTHSGDFAEAMRSISATTTV